MTMPDDINHGIRRTVEWLNEKGFETCDSGDGRTHLYECDRDYPYVVMRVKPERMVIRALFLQDLLKAEGVELSPIGLEPCVQASYDPVNQTAFLDLMNVDDTLLFGTVPSVSEI